MVFQQGETKVAVVQLDLLGFPSVLCARVHKQVPRIPVDNILFASEMIGAVRGIDPQTGHYFDDTKRYVELTPHLSEEDRRNVFEGNARRVYPRLDRALRAKGR